MILPGRRRAILADDMGPGKTRQSGAATHLTAARVLNSDARRRDQIVEQLRRAKKLAGI